MALENKHMTEVFRAKAGEWKENRADAMAQELYDNGIIKEVGQRTISGESLPAAFRWYQNKKVSEAAKGSTGVKGKALDSVNRLKMQYGRKRSLHIADIACRPAGCPDIVVETDENAASLLEKSRLYVEIKSGAGVIAEATSRDECLAILAESCERGKWIAWFFDVDAFRLDDTNAWNVVDKLPCIFLPVDHLMYYLQEYNGSVDTWLKFSGDHALNFQTVSNSVKKLGFLYDLYEKHSYDWPTFRDTGKLVKVGK